VDNPQFIKNGAFEAVTRMSFICLRKAERDPNPNTKGVATEKQNPSDSRELIGDYHFDWVGVFGGFDANGGKEEERVG
jgi:hypothetical protein